VNAGSALSSRPEYELRCDRATPEPPCWLSSGWNCAVDERTYVGAVAVATRHDRRVYWVLLYDLVDDYLERRGPLRRDHLAAANAAVERGELVLAGALADPADSAILVFQGEDGSAAERFAAGDPYVRNGLVRSWRVRPWTVVVGVGVTPPADVVGPA
jgi:uncharacterized protein YciI